MNDRHLHCVRLLEGVWAFRSVTFHVKVNTNNGIERHNRMLKHNFLLPYREHSLSSLVSVIVEKYLPSLWLKYIVACYVTVITVTFGCLLHRKIAMQ